LLLRNFNRVAGLNDERRDGMPEGVKLAARDLFSFGVVLYRPVTPTRCGPTLSFSDVVHGTVLNADNWNKLHSHGPNSTYRPASCISLPPRS